MSIRQASLSSLIDDRIALHPASGEINRKVGDAKKVQAAIESRYRDQAKHISRIDGLGMDFADWRFNLRASNTEPLLRLNVESRGSKALMEAKTKELLDQIGGEPG
jgi:phosphomannomutase